MKKREKSAKGKYAIHYLEIVEVVVVVVVVVAVLFVAFLWCERELSIDEWFASSTIILVVYHRHFLSER